MNYVCQYITQMKQKSLPVLYPTIPYIVYHL